MKDEIKEILDRLERIDHKEYSGGFEFADGGSFNEDCRCFEERKKLANYITNLQEENKILKELNICVGCNNNPDYKSRIEKAINYIKVQQKIFRDYDIVIENQLKNLLEILQGVGKDE